LAALAAACSMAKGVAMWRQLAAAALAKKHLAAQRGALAAISSSILAYGVSASQFYVFSHLSISMQLSAYVANSMSMAAAMAY